MQKDFEGDDRFYPITYLKDWAIVRKVAEESGTPYKQGRLREGSRARSRGLEKEGRAEETVTPLTPQTVSPGAPCAGDLGLARDPRPDQGISSWSTRVARHRSCSSALRPDRGHRPIRHRQEHADPLHQSPGAATSGEILFRGQDIAKLSGRALRKVRRRIGMVFQEYNLVERLTVMENLLCGRLGYVSAWRAWLRRFPPKDIERAFNLLDAVGLPGFRDAASGPPLSGGQRRARRYRSRDHAGARHHSGRRTDVFARSEDLGRDSWISSTRSP